MKCVRNKGHYPELYLLVLRATEVPVLTGHDFQVLKVSFRLIGFSLDFNFQDKAENP